MTEFEDNKDKLKQEFNKVTNELSSEQKTGFQAAVVMLGLVWLNKRIVTKAVNKAVVKQFATKTLMVTLDDTALRAAVTEAVNIGLRPRY